jgi:Mg-chelatase subunit ChlD
MKTKITGIFLFLLTLAAIASYPPLNARLVPDLDNDRPGLVPGSRPKIDVVFVLDTTGSMGGLIQTAKDKIWSIARTMASAQPTPDIRIGLVAYRDRGDAYVTQVVDLSSDLDSVYARLMDFDANGGGDTPESVNKALYDAVHKVSWSQDPQAYQVVFLIGDAPPHTDYQDELQYPEILAQAREKGIVVNTIQCGDMPITMEPWQQIASLGQGRYFQVEQAGGAVALVTPFDADIAALSAQLDKTRLYYGTGEEKERMELKVAATDKLNSFASVESLARRGAFNASPAGSANRLGEMELVDAISSGKVSLAELDDADLPESLKPLAPAEQEAVILQMTEERQQLTKQIRELADKRDLFLETKIAEEGGATDSLDQKIYETVSLQAAKAGLTYEGGPDY